MTAELTEVEAAEAVELAPPAERSRHIFTVSILTLRWVFLAVVTLIAFHRTFASLVDSTIEGSLNGFVWLMPVAAVVAGVGVARRERTELPIHDRQTDIIVGILGLVFAALLQSILLQRYAQYFHLLRIDIAALWFFLVSSSVVLFGLRPVSRFIWVWLLLLLSFPLWYQLFVIFLGGNRSSAGIACLLIAAAATAVSVGRTPGRAMVGAVAAMLVGTTVLVAMSVLAPDAPLLAFQLIPSLLSMSLVGLGLYGYARRGLPKRWLDRKLEPLAARQVWAGIPLVLAAALAIFLVPLPAGQLPARVDGLVSGRPLASPLGWQQIEQADYRWVRRIYGRDANLIRQEFVADVGNPAWDKFSRPRTVIVDSTSTWRPFSLQVYPAFVLYDGSSSRVSDPLPVHLGHGITGSAVTVVDDRRLLTFNLLTWAWSHEARRNASPSPPSTTTRPTWCSPNPTAALPPPCAPCSVSFSGATRRPGTATRRSRTSTCSQCSAAPWSTPNSRRSADDGERGRPAAFPGSGGQPAA